MWPRAGGNEPQRYPGVRVTDEIYLFLFNVQPLIMTTFEPEHDFENEDSAAPTTRSVSLPTLRRPSSAS